MHNTAVILVVGLNESLIGDRCPRIRDFMKAGAMRRLRPALPAVTTTVQSSMLTGLPPSQHGIVANGWYNREMAEVQFWKQSNPLVQGEKVWETARKRDDSFTVLNMFWWYNMYSSADWSVTPRPMYKADGRKIPDCYSHPASLRDELQAELGAFPLFQFWGPGSSIRSSRWIADATMLAFGKTNPSLTLVYLPHLDYAFQKEGPPRRTRSEDAAALANTRSEDAAALANTRSEDAAALANTRSGDAAALANTRSGDAAAWKAVAEIDEVVGDLLDFFAKRNVRPIIVSEYGIEAVDDSIHINRVLREAGLLRVRREQGLELLDAGASDAFAVADHQIAHVYVRRHGGTEARRHGGKATVKDVAAICGNIPGIEHVLDREAQQHWNIAHERSGDLVLIADARHWFSYDHWLDDAKAPDFARTVDIHRKPGYDPLELFIDPAIRFPKLKIAWRLFQRKILRQRTLLDVIPLDTKLVRGSHGRVDQPADMQPVIISQQPLPEAEALPCTMVRDLILASLFNQ